MIKHIGRLHQGKITVVGDVMLDRYWLGPAHRVSPEAPVPVVAVEEDTARPGGAGNVALNLASLGVSTTLLSYVGQDEAAKQLKQALDEASVAHQLVDVKDWSTIVKLRVLSRDQQLIRLDFESSCPAVSGVPAAWHHDLEATDVVILSDYAKGALQNAADLIHTARQARTPVLVDPKGHDFARYRGATLLTPNRAELEQVAGPWTSRQEMVEKAKGLIASLELEALLVTLGKEGMCLISKEHEPYYLSAHAQSVYDVTGAGDTVIATLAAGLAAGFTLRESAVLANLAAGIVVRKLGAAQVTLSDLRRAWHTLHPQQQTVVSKDELRLLVQDARAHGERIVMTNGCFDILHAGHVRYLQQAKALGDRLIVAINDDASIKRLKGATRPINSLERRQEVLAALASVDYVVDFSEDTPEALLKAIRPDVLVKGGDYAPHEVVGHDIVEGYGGEVQVLALVPGASTTNMVEALNEADKALA